MNAETVVRQFLALFHTSKLDVGAVRAMLADDSQYKPVVPIAPVRQARTPSARSWSDNTNFMTNAPAIFARSRLRDRPFSRNGSIHAGS